MAFYLLFVSESRSVCTVAYILFLGTLYTLLGVVIEW